MTVLVASGGGRFPIHATARGSDGDYDLGFDKQSNEWRCECEANSKFHRRCSHLIALQLVTRKPATGERSGK